MSRYVIVLIFLFLVDRGLGWMKEMLAGNGGQAGEQESSFNPDCFDVRYVQLL